jgi:hypothetical protein
MYSWNSEHFSRCDMPVITIAKQLNLDLTLINYKLLLFVSFLS